MFGLLGISLDILMFIVVIGIVLLVARIIGKIVLTLAGFGLLIAAVLLYITFHITLWWMLIAGCLALIIKFIW